MTATAGQATQAPADEFDLEARFQDLIARVNDKLPLTVLPVAPELAEPRSFLKILKARLRHSNLLVFLPPHRPQGDLPCER